MAIQINGTSGISGVDGSAATPALQGSDSNTGISFGTDTVSINTGGTARATVDSSGRLGIGTSTFSVGTSNELSVNGSSSSSVSLKRGDALAGYVGCTSSQMVVNSVSNLPLLFYTNDTERARIDGSGRLLVGTSSSNADYNSNLQIASASASFLVSQYSNNASGPIAYFYKSRNTTIGSGTIVQNGDELGAIYFGGSDGATTRQAASIQALVDGTPGSGDYPGRIVLSTTADGASSPTEAMRINSKGQVGINYTGTGNGRGLFLKGSTSSDADNTIYLVNSANTSVDLAVRNDGYLRSEAVYSKTSGSAANIFVDINGFFYRSTSSERYKRDIVEAPYTLEQIDRLRAVNYKSSSPNSDGEVSDQVFGGLIAEEVNQAGFEEFVVFDDQGRPDALQYGHMIAVAIKGLQEAHARIKTLEARLTTLEGGTN